MFKPEQKYLDGYKFIDLFAGIGGFRLALESLGAECVYSNEWDRNAQKVYYDNFNDLPDGDITKVNEKDIPVHDILCAGFPCQAFSISGKKKGFEDSRGTLFFDVARIIKEKKPKAFLLENVKGLLNHRSGKTLETIINTLEDDLGYTTYYKVLNAKDYGLAQNRERIYIVGFLEGGSGYNYPEPSNEKKVIRDILEEKPVAARYYLSTVYIKSMKAHKARHEALGHGFGYEIRNLDDVAGTIVCGGMGRERNLIIDPRQTDFSNKGHKKGEINNDGLRVMTPLEWERLQGFPDNWTDGLANGHRYKQMGNSVAVPVIEKISENIIRELLNPTSTPHKKPKQLSLF